MSTLRLDKYSNSNDLYSQCKSDKSNSNSNFILRSEALNTKQYNTINSNKTLTYIT